MIVKYDQIVDAETIKRKVVKDVVKVSAGPYCIWLKCKDGFTLSLSYKSGYDNVRILEDVKDENTKS